jgi:hypothetical protein
MTNCVAFSIGVYWVEHAGSRGSSAAKEVKELIEDAVQRVGFGDEQVSRAGTTMEVVVRSVKLVSAIMAGYSHVAGMLLARCEKCSGSCDHVVPQIIEDRFTATETGDLHVYVIAVLPPCSLSSIAPLKLGVAGGSQHCTHVRDGVTLAGKVRSGYG